MSAEPQPDRIIVVRGGRAPSAGGGGGGIKLDFGWLALPAIVAGGVVFVALYKDELQEILDKVLDIPKDIIDNIPKPEPKPQPEPDGNGNGNGGGGVTSTSLWYKANGSTANMPNRRCDGESNRWENEVNWGNLPGYEVVVYFTVPKGSMQSGSHIGLKHGGPNHTSPCDFSVSGDCCCWWDTGLRRDGRVYVEVEHPHPNNINTKYYGNIGRPIDNGQTLGVRWHIMKEGSGVRIRQWVDTSGKVQGNQWRETYNVLDTFNGNPMPSDYKSKAFTNKQNIEIRISDVACKSIKMNYGPVSRQITSSSNLAYAYASSDFDRVSNL